MSSPRIRIAILVGVCASFVPAFAGASRFTFKVPDGWTDLSPNAPKANFDRLPPELVQRIRGQHFSFYAADLEHAADGFMENVNVTVEAGTVRVTEGLLREMAENLDAEVRKQAPGMSIQLLDKGTLDVGGVTWGRYVSLLDMSGVKVKQIGYVIPGHEEHAIMTWSTTPGEFEHYRPIFDAAAQATLGSEQPSAFWGRIARSSGRGALYGGIGGAIGALLFGLTRRKKKKEA